MERRRLTGSSCERPHFSLDSLAKLQRAFTALDRDTHRHTLYRDYLAYELSKVGNRPSELAGPHVQECLLLLGSCLVINVNHHPPVALQDVAWDVGQDGQVAPRHV